MLKTLRSKTKAGFTLVEIMIVVAIIALLASIAVPNFLRARKRSQATRILEDARILEAAKDQWAIETNQPGTADVTLALITPYLKDGSPLVANGGKDILNGTYVLTNKVDGTITVDPATLALFTVGDTSKDLFKDAAEQKAFWGSHMASEDD